MPLAALPNPADIVTSYFGLGLLLYLTGVGLPIPEEVTLVLAGAAVAQGELQLAKLLPVAAIAILMADLQVYLIGRYFGRPIIQKRFFRFILPAARIDAAEKKFQAHSIWAVFTVRFVSGLRGPTYFTAGMLRLPLLKFALTDLVAVCIHIVIFTTLGRIFAGQINTVIKYVRRADKWVGIAALVALIAVFALVRYGIYRRRNRSRPVVDRASGARNPDESG